MTTTLTINDGDVVPVFPLPRYVLFPYITTPLHVFEPRYRRMLEYVLDRRGLLCLATLRGHWRKKYQTKEADVFPVGCVAELTEYERHADGRYNIIVYGRHRVRLDEVETTEPFRMARIEICDAEPQPFVPDDAVETMRKQAKALLLPGREAPQEMAAHLERIPARMLMNVLAFYGPFTVKQKLALLLLPTYAEFAQQLIELAGGKSASNGSEE